MTEFLHLSKFARFRNNSGLNVAPARITSRSNRWPSRLVSVLLLPSWPDCKQRGKSESSALQQIMMMSADTLCFTKAGTWRTIWSRRPRAQKQYYRSGGPQRNKHSRGRSSLHFIARRENRKRTVFSVSRTRANKLSDSPLLKRQNYEIHELLSSCHSQ